MSVIAGAPFYFERKGVRNLFLGLQEMVPDTFLPKKLKKGYKDVKLSQEEIAKLLGKTNWKIFVL